MGQKGRREGEKEAFTCWDDLCLGKEDHQSIQMGWYVVSVLYQKDFSSGLPSNSYRAVWEPCSDRKENHVKSSKQTSKQEKKIRLLS